MTKKELRELISEEMAVYGITKKNYREKRFRHSKNYMIWAALKRFRVYEYLCAKRDGCSNTFIGHLISFRVKHADRKLNMACERVNIELTPNMIGRNIRICHCNVILYGHIGEGCTFHGNNVVGNKRTGATDEMPTLGKNVDVGAGAIIIGDIKLADGCVVGAGAVVTKSFTKPGSVIVGVPAREM